MSDPISIDHLSEKAKHDYGLVLKATQNKNQQNIIMDYINKNEL